MDTGAVYDAHFDYVWTNLRRLGVPARSLEDACHDVFLVVHRRADAYDRSCAIRTWLFGIVRRVAAQYRRKDGRDQQRHAMLSAVTPAPARPDDDWSRRVWMRDFLRGLEPEKREAFVMLELEQMSAREASELTGINPNTLAARLRSVRRMIDASLVDNGLIERGRRTERAPAEARGRVMASLAPFLGTKTWWPATAKLWLTGLAVSAAATAIVLPAALDRDDVVADEIVAAATPASEPPRPDATPANAVAIGEAALEPPPPVGPPDPVPAPFVEPPPAPTPDARTKERRKPAARSDHTSGPTSGHTSGRATPTESDNLKEQSVLASKVFAATDPGTILDLVGEYRQRFGRGFFGDRLTVHEVEALCKRGQASAARHKIEALQRRSKALAGQARRRCEQTG